MSKRRIRRVFSILRPEDKVRLISYFFAIAWPIVFLLFQPPSYSAISDIIIHIWMCISAVGGIAAIIGTLTGIDLKLELPALYLILMGPTLYFFAQIGFMLGGDVQGRLALTAFVLWHISLMMPRIVALETFRRHERLRKDDGY